MKKDDILKLENQIKIMEKEVVNLESYYAQRDISKFESSRNKITSSNKIINEIIK